GGLDLPKLLDAPIIQLGAETGPQEEPAEVQPARLVLGTAGTLMLSLPQHIPQFADRRQRPGIFARPEVFFQDTRQTDGVPLAGALFRRKDGTNGGDGPLQL